MWKTSYHDVSLQNFANNLKNKINHLLHVWGKVVRNETLFKYILNLLRSINES